MQVKGYQALDSIMEELGNLLLQQTAYHECRQMIERFQSDDAAIREYEQFIVLQEELHEKEQRGETLDDETIQAYNRAERTIYDHTTIRQFIYAQNELMNLQHSLAEYFKKTIENGRLPIKGELRRYTHGCGTHQS